MTALHPAPAVGTGGRRIAAAPRDAAAPLPADERWPVRTLMLLERELAAAERAADPARIAAAGANLDAERMYVGRLVLIGLQCAAEHFPHELAAALALPVEGDRDDLLRLAARVAGHGTGIADLAAQVAALRAAAERPRAGEGS